MPEQLAARLSPEDVLQESYVAAEKRMGQCRKEGFYSPFIWLRMIVCQTLVDLCRHHLGVQARDAGREVAIHAKSYPEATSASMAICLVANQTSPSGRAMRNEMVNRIEEAIALMEPVDQEILALRHFEELDNKEVAAVLEIQPKAASIRYIRALKRLKDVLAEIEDPESEKG